MVLGERFDVVARDYGHTVILTAFFQDRVRQGRLDDFLRNNSYMFQVFTTEPDYIKVIHLPKL